MKITFPNGIIVEDPDEETKRALLAALKPPRPVPVRPEKPVQTELFQIVPQKNEKGRGGPGPSGSSRPAPMFLSHAQAKTKMLYVALALKKNHPVKLSRRELGAAVRAMIVPSPGETISDQTAYDAANNLQCAGIAFGRRSGGNAIRWALDASCESLTTEDFRKRISEIPDNHPVWGKRPKINLPSDPAGISAAATK